MVRRCTVETEYRYDRYGGRGISVCPQWINDFECFLRDMGARPDGTTIDRIDNNGNYEPENCKWSTQIEQCSNMSSNVMITHEGITDHVTGWARRIGCKPSTLRQRIRSEWSISDMLNVPINPINKSNVTRYEYNGESLTIPQWADRTGIPRNTIGNRIASGMTMSEALTMPYRKLGPRKKAD